MDDGDQYFEKIIIYVKNIHNAMCYILIDG
jgi:hypothetical protein